MFNPSSFFKKRDTLDIRKDFLTSPRSSILVTTLYIEKSQTGILEAWTRDFIDCRYVTKRGA